MFIFSKFDFVYRINRMQEFGLFERWFRNEESKLTQLRHTGNVKCLSLNEVNSIYMLWIIGLSTSLTSFAIECVLHWQCLHMKFILWKH